MSFDRLEPANYGELYSCVRKTQDGYQVVAVPPCLGLLNKAEDYRPSNGWDHALDNCRDMAMARREYLKEQMKIIRAEPEQLAKQVQDVLRREVRSIADH